MNKNKVLDLRFVIGVFFAIIGLLLVGYSFLQLTYEINEFDGRLINRWCGVLFSLFGIAMIILSFRKDAADELLQE